MKTLKQLSIGWVQRWVLAQRCVVSKCESHGEIIDDIVSILHSDRNVIGTLMSFVHVTVIAS